jgi:hypothetical protein
VSRPWTVSPARHERALNNGDGSEQPDDMIDRPDLAAIEHRRRLRSGSRPARLHLTMIDYYRLLEQANDHHPPDFYDLERMSKARTSRIFEPVRAPLFAACRHSVHAGLDVAVSYK